MKSTITSYEIKNMSLDKVCNRLNSRTRLKYGAYESLDNSNKNIIVNILSYSKFNEFIAYIILHICFLKHSIHKINYSVHTVRK